MATPDEIRLKIKNLLLEKGISLASASVGIGKNVAYLQQYIVKGAPVRLPEEQRKKLSIILDVPEQELTDLDLSAMPLPASFEGAASIAQTIGNFFSNIKNKKETIAVDMLDTTACCGNGIENFAENVNGKWLMPLADFRQITMTAPDNIKLLKVRGDSMEPTLKEGDWVLVDITHVAPDSDGMFLLRMSTGLAVKRLQGGITQDVIVKSDNPKYDNITANIGEIRILGKVIYTLKADKVG